MMLPRIPLEIINLLASVPRERQVMTKDGLVYDGVRYRFSPERTTTALSANYHRTPHRYRLKGTAKIFVRIRCWDGNIDRIEVIDDDTGEGFSMWSTNPLYTGGLSRWEHHQYQEMMRKRLGPGQVNLDQDDVEREIMATKAQFLGEFDDRRPTLSLQGSAIPTALVECEERRQAMLEEAASRGGTADLRLCHQETDRMTKGCPEGSAQHELFSDLDGSLAERNYEKPVGRVVAGEGREDEPRPPKQPSTRSNKPPWPKAPQRDDGFGSCSTAGLTRPQDIITGPRDGHGANEQVSSPEDTHDGDGQHLWPDAQ